MHLALHGALRTDSFISGQRCLGGPGHRRAAPTPIAQAGVTSCAMAHLGTDAIVAWIDTPPYVNHGNPADPLVQNRMGLQRVKLGM